MVKTSWQTALFFITMLGMQALIASDLYVYPAKGQSTDQQGKDEYECYQWAKRDTGFDPMAVPTTKSPAPSSLQRRGGVAGVRLVERPSVPSQVIPTMPKKARRSVACSAVCVSDGRM